MFIKFMRLLTNISRIESIPSYWKTLDLIRISFQGSMKHFSALMLLEDGAIVCLHFPPREVMEKCDVLWIDLSLFGTVWRFEWIIFIYLETKRRATKLLTWQYAWLHRLRTNIWCNALHTLTMIHKANVWIIPKIKASEMLVAPRISEYFLKSLKF